MKTIIDSYREQVDNTPEEILANTHYLYLKVVAYAQRYWGTDDIYAEAHHCENCDQPSKDGYKDYNGHNFCEICYNDFANQEPEEKTYDNGWTDDELFDLHYYCTDCDLAWDDEYSSYVDDDCEECGQTYTPFDSLEDREKALVSNATDRLKSIAKTKELSDLADEIRDATNKVIREKLATKEQDDEYLGSTQEDIDRYAVLRWFDKHSQPNPDGNTLAIRKTEIDGRIDLEVIDVTLTEELIRQEYEDGEDSVLSEILDAEKWPEATGELLDEHYPQDNEEE